MTKIPECLIKPDAARALKAVKALARALRLDIPQGDLEFHCPGCGGRVQPIGAHFEHQPKNPRCPLVLERKQQKRGLKELTND